MPLAGEREYVWAKAAGLLGSSFLGERRSLLLGAARGADLERLIFPDSPSNLPERALLARLQARIAERSAARALRIVAGFSSPPEALLLMLRSYEVADLKAALSAISSGAPRPPGRTELGRRGSLRWDRYPDLRAMVRGSGYSWMAPPESAGDLPRLEAELDRRYYRALWESVAADGSKDGPGLRALVAEELSLKNVAWTLRLRAYYGVSADALENSLLRAGGSNACADARSAFGLALDRYDDWRGWRRAYLLNPPPASGSWRLDPRWVQNAAARRLYALARRTFRTQPCTVGAAAGFLKLNQYEEDLLTSAAEALTLGIGVREALENAGALS